MIGSLQLSLPLSWNRRHGHGHGHGHRHRQQPLLLLTECTLAKQGHRFLTSLAATGDVSAANRLIRKFIASSPKSVALNALSHLLSPNTTHPHLSALALPLYSRITEASWFNWNPKLVAELIALLEKQERFEEAQTLISETVSKLWFRERDLVCFYCNLINSHSEHKSNRGILDSYARLNQLLSNSSSVYVKRRAYESMISGLCEMGQPQEAENLMEDMRTKGFKLSAYDFRSVMYGYGKLGLFKDMQRILGQMENEGFAIDTICSNMVLSSYGAHKQQSEMVQWLKRMKDLGINFSIRTYNSVLNSCQTILSLFQDSEGFPLSIEELTQILNGDERLLVKELVESSVLVSAMEWSSSEAKLDLHGMHLGSTYLIMLQWMEEIRSMFRAGNYVIPEKITVVCGAGKHSNVRGESRVKDMVKEIMVRSRSPMKIDRKNIGCFVAKGKVVKDWLC